MQHQLAELNKLLSVALDMVSGIQTRIAELQVDRHRDAISPYVPQGYDTVLGYLAKHHPDVLDHVDYYDPSVTTRDGWKMSHLCTRKGARVVYVDAPPCLQSAGIERVRAYPIALLATRW